MRDEDDLRETIRAGIRRLGLILLFDALLLVGFAPAGLSAFWRGAQQIEGSLFWIIVGGLSFISLFLPDRIFGWCLRCLILLTVLNFGGCAWAILNWGGH